MIGIIKLFRDELPLMAEFYKYHYRKKKQYRVVRNTNKELPNKKLLEEIFYPKDASNIETDFLIEEHGAILAKTLITELTDKIKAIYNYLSAVDRIYS